MIPGIIKHQTTVTQYNGDIRIKPKSSLWTIVNTGSAPFFINNNYRLLWGQSFGLDVTNLFGATKNIEVENDTEFDIKFDTRFGDVPDQFKYFSLIETVFTPQQPQLTNMKILYRTTMTLLSDNTRIKPRSPLWAIVNHEYTPVIINNNYRIFQGQKFGIDVTNALLIDKNIEIENDTEFDVRFDDSQIIGFPKVAQLIETFFEIIK